MASGSFRDRGPGAKMELSASPAASKARYYASEDFNGVRTMKDDLKTGAESIAPERPLAGTKQPIFSLNDVADLINALNSGRLSSILPVAGSFRELSCSCDGAVCGCDGNNCTCNVVSSSDFLSEGDYEQLRKAEIARLKKRIQELEAS